MCGRKNEHANDTMMNAVARKHILIIPEYPHFENIKEMFPH